MAAGPNRAGGARSPPSPESGEGALRPPGDGTLDSAERDLQRPVRRRPRRRSDRAGRSARPGPPGDARSMAARRPGGSGRPGARVPEGPSSHPRTGRASGPGRSTRRTCCCPDVPPTARGCRRTQAGLRRPRVEQHGLAVGKLRGTREDDGEAIMAGVAVSSNSSAGAPGRSPRASARSDFPLSRRRRASPRARSNGALTSAPKSIPPPGLAGGLSRSMPYCSGALESPWMDPGGGGGTKGAAIGAGMKAGRGHRHRPADRHAAHHQEIRRPAVRQRVRDGDRPGDPLAGLAAGRHERRRRAGDAVPKRLLHQQIVQGVGGALARVLGVDRGVLGRVGPLQHFARVVAKLPQPLLQLDAGASGPARRRGRAARRTAPRRPGGWRRPAPVSGCTVAISCPSARRRNVGAVADLLPHRRRCGRPPRWPGRRQVAEVDRARRRSRRADPPTGRLHPGRSTWRVRSRRTGAAQSASTSSRAVAMSSSAGSLVRKRATPPPRSASSLARPRSARRRCRARSTRRRSAGAASRSASAQDAAGVADLGVGDDQRRGGRGRPRRAAGSSACSSATPSSVPPLSLCWSRKSRACRTVRVVAAPRLPGEPAGRGVEQPEGERVARAQAGEQVLDGPVGRLPLRAAPSSPSGRSAGSTSRGRPAARRCGRRRRRPAPGSSVAALAGSSWRRTWSAGRSACAAAARPGRSRGRASPRRRAAGRAPVAVAVDVQRVRRAGDAVGAVARQVEGEAVAGVAQHAPAAARRRGGSRARRRGRSGARWSAAPAATSPRPRAARAGRSSVSTVDVLVRLRMPATWRVKTSGDSRVTSAACRPSLRAPGTLPRPRRAFGKLGLDLDLAEPDADAGHGGVAGQREAVDGLDRLRDSAAPKRNTWLQRRAAASGPRRRRSSVRRSGTNRRCGSGSAGSPVPPSTISSTGNPSGREFSNVRGLNTWASCWR